MRDLAVGNVRVGAASAPRPAAHIGLEIPGAMAIDDDTRFTTLLTSFAPSLRRLCASYARDAAEREDLMQEVAFALWKALRSFRGECSERTFVYRVAQNRLLSHRFRSRVATVSLDSADAMADPMTRADAAAEAASERERLLRAVRALPETLRHVVALRLEGLSDREVGDVLGISEGNVAVRLTRARRELRVALGTGSGATSTHEEGR